MQTIFYRNLAIPCYDTDRSLKIKPTAFLNYAQDMAGDHAELLDFGVEPLLERNLVWVITRMKVEFLKMPQWRDNVKIRTWHRGYVGAFFVREFLMHSESDELLARATTSWVLFNIQDRKMERPDDIGSNTDSVNDESYMEPCSRLRLPRNLELQKVGSHVVSYSDIDKNGHANNVKYTEWAMDTLDQEFLNSTAVKTLEIDFINEAHPGDEVTLYSTSVTNEDGSLTWYFRGMLGETESYVLKLDF